MRNQIVQFITGPDAFIAASYAGPTSQQRFVLNQTTGQVYWDVHGIRHSVNAIVNLDRAITVNGQNAVSGSAVWSYGQQLKATIQRSVTSIISSIGTVPTTTQAVIQNSLAIPTAGAVYTFVTSTLASLPSVKNITQLTDVNIANPTQAQILAYNSVTSKWQNKTVEQEAPAKTTWTVYTEA